MHMKKSLPEMVQQFLYFYLSFNSVFLVIGVLIFWVNLWPVFFKQSIRELKKKIQSHLRTAIQYAVGTGHIADHYHDRLFQATNQIKKLTNIVILLDTGHQTTIAGAGEVFEKFLQTGLLQNFTGYGQRPVKFDDEHFEDLDLRMMTFAEMFADMDYDCRESTHLALFQYCF